MASFNAEGYFPIPRAVITGKSLSWDSLAPLRLPFLKSSNILLATLGATFAEPIIAPAPPNSRLEYAIASEPAKIDILSRLAFRNRIRFRKLYSVYFIRSEEHTSELQ